MLTISNVTLDSDTVKRWLQDNWFKLGVLSALFVFVLVLAYYLLVSVPSRQSANQQAREIQRLSLILAKQDCHDQAQDTAVQLYQQSSYCTGRDRPDDCGNGTYNVKTYDNAYRICLQGKGLR